MEQEKYNQEGDGQIEEKTAEQAAANIETVHTNLKDLVQQVTGALLAAYALFVTLNIEFEWLTPESINAFGLFAIAFIAVAMQAWVTWRNSYLTKKGLERAAKTIDENKKV